jgi:transposase-like protein
MGILSFLPMPAMRPAEQFCDNPSCALHDKIGAGNVRIHSVGQRRFSCRICRKTWSETKGTFFYALKKDRRVVLTCLHAMAEGMGLNATGRVHHVTVDALLEWIEKAARHSREVTDALIADLHLTQVQIDEFWSFIRKKTSALTRRRMTSQR